MKFCSACAQPVRLEVPAGDNLPRYVCPNCHSIHYQNPKLVVGALVYEPGANGRMLLCKRAIEPRQGLWTAPAGFMENGETVAQGAQRECVEEAGVHVRLVQPFSMMSLPHVCQVYVLYLAELLDLDFAAGEESEEVALFDYDELPRSQIAFRAIGRSLEHFYADRRRGHFGFHAEDVLPGHPFPPRV